jgi:hypothetical protein
MCTANRKWSKGKWFNVVQSQLDYLLWSVLCALITIEPKSLFSYVTTELQLLFVNQIPNPSNTKCAIRKSRLLSTWCGTEQ